MCDAASHSAECGDVCGAHRSVRAAVRRGRATIPISPHARSGPEGLRGSSSTRTLDRHSHRTRPAPGDACGIPVISATSARRRTAENRWEPRPRAGLPSASTPACSRDVDRRATRWFRGLSTRPSVHHGSRDRPAPRPECPNDVDRCVMRDAVGSAMAQAAASSVAPAPTPWRAPARARSSWRTAWPYHRGVQRKHGTALPTCTARDATIRANTHVPLSSRPQR